MTLIHDHRASGAPTHRAQLPYFLLSTSGLTQPPSHWDIIPQGEQAHHPTGPPTSTSKHSQDLTLVQSNHQTIGAPVHRDQLPYSFSRLRSYHYPTDHPTQVLYMVPSINLDPIRQPSHRVPYASLLSGFTHRP
jgi:hypothetical protein